MSDPTESSPENSPSESKPSIRPPRKAAPRARKSTKVAKKAKGDVEAVEPVAATPIEETSPPAVAQDASASVVEAPPAETIESRPSSDDGANQVDRDWPEPDAESSGGNQGQGESGKRKRRRRKGKGGQGNSGQGNGDETSPPPEPMITEGPRDSNRPRPQAPQPQQQQPPRPKADPEQVAKMAWKIYLAEVSEEGVALIGDNDAKDLSRRCFRLAEIFIEEQSRRR